MIIIIKALLSGLLEKKARIFLVLFSIAVSASLIFANESFSRTCEKMFYDADVRWCGNSDFYIQTKESIDADEWIDTSKMSQFETDFSYIFSFIKEQALYIPNTDELHYFTVIGADIDEFNTYNPVVLEDGSIDDWQGYKIIIGKTYAEKLGVSTGDIISLEMNGKPYDFQISGVSKASGLFLRELADGGYMLAPKDTLTEIFGGSCNLMFMQLKDKAIKSDMMIRLTEDLPQYHVAYGINDSLIAAETLNYVLPFRISAIFVILMSIFIIYTSFDLITMDIITTIGTLRSVGCTHKKINAILLAESSVIGLAGGLIGCVFGIGCLHLIKVLYFRGEEVFINAELVFGLNEVMLTIIAAIVLTSLSALLPILRTTKEPVKNIILNDIRKEKITKSKLWIPGIILLMLCLAIPPFLPKSFTGMIIGSSLAAGAFIGLICLIPQICTAASALAGKIPFLRYEAKLGIRNIRDSKSLINSVKLFAVTIAIVTFLLTIFNTLSVDLHKMYEEDNFDISLKLRDADDSSVKKISEIDGVKSCIGALESYTTSFTVPNAFMNGLYGIDSDYIFDYKSVEYTDSTKAALSTLNDGRNIILTTIMSSKFGIKMGDTIAIRLDGKNVSYTVTGFVVSNRGIGHVGYISSENFRKDACVKTFNSIYIKTDGKADEVKLNIIRSLSKDILSIQTKQELREANIDKVDGVFNSINSYTYLAMLVGIIGIVNNIVASFLERKRSLAMYRCVGMSKKGIRTMLVTESVMIGGLGVGAGLLSGLIMIQAIPAVVSVIWGDVLVVPAAEQMLTLGIAGIAVMLIVSSIPVIKSNKLSIIESMKYE